MKNLFFILFIVFSLAAFSSLISGKSPNLYTGEPNTKYTVVKQINAKCCTALCWPDGILGNNCSFKRLKKSLIYSAQKHRADAIIYVSYLKSKEKCNQLCGAINGKYLKAKGTLVKFK